MSQMTRLRCVVGLAVATLLSAGCGQASYEGLGQLELSYVIPNSASWGTGDPCAEADCGGPITADELSASNWIAVAGVRIVEGPDHEGQAITVEMNTKSISTSQPSDPFVGRAWGEDVRAASDALEEGHEVWASTQCPGLEPDYICHFIAFDEAGRFAGLGYGKALYLTTPLAQMATRSNATSGRSFVESLVVDH